MLFSSSGVAVMGIILIDPLIGQHVRIYHEIMDDSTGWTLGNNDGNAPIMPHINANCVNTPSCCMLPFIGGFASKIFSTEGYHNIYVKWSVFADGTTYSTDALWLYVYPDANFNADNMNTYWYPDTFNADHSDPPLNITFYPVPNANYIDNKANMKLEWALGSSVSSVYWVYLSHLEIYGIPIAVNPTLYPANDPTYNPTHIPTHIPTTDPTNDPTFNPTHIPTNDPTQIPTLNPITTNPTYVPTLNPTHIPTEPPTFNPTVYPTQNPSTSPTDVASGNVLATNITTFQSKNGDGNGNNNKEFIWILISILSVIACINIVFAAVYFNKKRKSLQMSRSITIGSETMEDINIENIEGDHNGSVEKECGDNEPEISDDSGEDLYSNMHATNVEMITPNYKTTIKDESETDDSNDLHVTANKATGDMNDGVTDAGIGDV